MGTTSEREDFSRRLRQLLHKAGIEAKGAVRLAQDFNDRYSGKPVTHQAAQKWLNGESIPTQDKLRVLAEWLQTTPEWLRYGPVSEVATSAAHDVSNVYRIVLTDHELVKRYRKLTDRQQQALAEIITALAAKDSRR